MELLTAMKGLDRVDAWEAAKELGSGLIDTSLSLITMMEEADQAHTKEAAAYVLGCGRVLAAREALETVLGNTAAASSLRGHAAEALASIGHSDSTDALLRQLDDADAGVRYWCVFALGRIAGPNVIPLLRAFAERVGAEQFGQHSLRQEALDALTEIERRADSTLRY